MLEKFYFESFLIAFSAFVGAIFSHVVSEIMKKPKIALRCKIGFIAISLLVAFVFVISVLWVAISVIGIINWYS
jgi:hypothetical protein